MNSRWCSHRDKVTARVHPVHLTNVGQLQMAANPRTKPTNLGCESASASTQPKSRYSFYRPTIDYRL